MTEDDLQAIDFSRTDSLSGEQVGEFISQEMLITHPNGEPNWSVGIGVLVEHGMMRWNYEEDLDPATFQDELHAVYEETREMLGEYEQKIRDLQKENEILRKKLENERSTSPPS